MGFTQSAQDVTVNILTMTMDSAESMTADAGKTPLEEREKPQLMVRIYRRETGACLVAKRSSTPECAYNTPAELALVP